MTGLSISPHFVDHLTGPHHPERPDRIRAIYAALHQSNILSGPSPFPDFDLDLGPLPANSSIIQLVPPTPAPEEVIQLCHPKSHIDRIRHICAHDGGVLDHGDTPVSPKSFDTALLAAGALLNCCDAVLTNRVQRAFSTGRPPGHHAEPDRPMGFCLFSNIAIAARYIQHKYKIQRIAIVDFDVHHGNGTQACLEDDPSIFFVSLHQHPATCYPGSGYDWETGVGAGRGYTMNVPFDPGAEDDDYLAVLNNKVLPALDAFGPEVLLISAGFDAHRDDPLAQINLSEEGFERITNVLISLANQHCQGRIISSLEGGYNLRALARCALRHLTALTGN